MTRREVIAHWLAERERYHTVNQATLAFFLGDADDLLQRLDTSPLWTVTDVCNYTGLTSGTISSYRARCQMPEPALRYGRTHLWEPDVIRAWRPR
jgi:hypothetical protein